MASNKVRGLGNVACNALYSVFCLVLNREASQNIGTDQTKQFHQRSSTHNKETGQCTDNRFLVCQLYSFSRSMNVLENCGVES